MWQTDNEDKIFFFERVNNSWCALCNHPAVLVILIWMIPPSIVVRKLWPHAHSVYPSVSHVWREPRSNHSCLRHCFWIKPRGTCWFESAWQDVMADSSIYVKSPTSEKDFSHKYSLLCSYTVILYNSNGRAADWGPWMWMSRFPAQLLKVLGYVEVH